MDAKKMPNWEFNSSHNQEKFNQIKMKQYCS